MAETKKVSQIFEAKRSVKGSNFSHLEQQVGQAVQDAVNHYDGENKRIASFIKINKVIEIPMGKEKPALLIYVSFRAQKVLLSNLYKKLVSDLEKKLKTTVLIVAARNIESRWIKQNKTQQRSYSRTLTSVYQ
jgi:small subunit ribosomal protein S7e